MWGLYSIVLFVLSFHSIFYASPLVVAVNNRTNIGYLVIKHADQSACSLAHRGHFFPPQTVTKSEFLLVDNIDNHGPALILRPATFFDPVEKITVSFLDKDAAIDQEQLEKAFVLWKKSIGKINRKIKTANQWLDLWIGGDIKIDPQDVEFAGYLKDLVRAVARNNHTQHQVFLSYSKGIFSKLLIEIDIVGRYSRPIKVRLQVYHGQGGICVEQLDPSGHILGHVEKI